MKKAPSVVGAWLCTLKISRASWPAHHMMVVRMKMNDSGASRCHGPLCTGIGGLPQADAHEINPRTPMSLVTVYAGLFAAAFLAATIFPAQSEAVLAGLIMTGDYPVVALVTVASVGNVLGSVVNWGLGRGIERFKNRRWFPAKPNALDRAQGWYRRYGKWSLLLSWVPFIGDPLTVVAGIMREPLAVFLALVTVAKAGRYIALAALLL